MFNDEAAAMITLRHEKANKGPKAPPLHLHWAKDDIPRRADPAEERRRQADPSRFLPLLRELADVTRRDGVVRVGNGVPESVRNVLGRALVQAGAIESDTEALRLVHGAAAAGLVAKKPYSDPAARKERERLELTPAGRALSDSAADLGGAQDSAGELSLWETAGAGVACARCASCASSAPVDATGATPAAAHPVRQ